MNQPLAYHTIRDIAEWEAIRPEWDQLVRDSRHRSAAMEYQWLREWWREYAESGAIAGARLHIATVRSGTRLVAAIPLYLRKMGVGGAVRELRLLSTGEKEFDETCVDGLDIISSSADSQASALVIVAALHRTKWDLLHLERIPIASAILTAIKNGEYAWPVPTVLDHICPIADLSEGFDEYVQSLSSSARGKVRQLLRAAEARNASVALATADTATTYFEELVKLHQERWAIADQPGCFASKLFTNFHRELATQWVSEKRAVIARVAVDGRSIALIYGFVVDKRFEFYQSGSMRDSINGIQSPGVTAHLMLMRELAKIGVKTYDFLAGESEYKRRLSNDQARLATVTWERRSVRWLIWRCERLARRAIKRFKRKASASE